MQEALRIEDLDMRLVLILVGIGLVAGCSSSLGGGGGSPPARTYIVLPNGQTVLAPQPND